VLLDLLSVGGDPLDHHAVAEGHIEVIAAERGVGEIQEDRTVGPPDLDIISVEEKKRAGGNDEAGLFVAVDRVDHELHERMGVETRLPDRAAESLLPDVAGNDNFGEWRREEAGAWRASGGCLRRMNCENA